MPALSHFSLSCAIRQCRIGGAWSTLWGLPMDATPARSTRPLIAVTFAAAVLALYTGCGDQSTARNGGGDIPGLSAGSASEAGAAGAQSVGRSVPWCDAYK